MMAFRQQSKQELRGQPSPAMTSMRRVNVMGEHVRRWNRLAAQSKAGRIMPDAARK